MSSGYHPQTNGQTERANQQLESMLRCVTATNPSSWSSFLPWVEYAYNSQPSAATGLSPFEAPLGYLPPLFPSQEEEIAVPSGQGHLRHCWRIWSQTQRVLLRTTHGNERSANCRWRPTPTYTEGQLVWLSSQTIPLRVEYRKLAPHYLGPFSIIKVLGSHPPCKFIQSSTSPN